MLTFRPVGTATAHALAVGEVRIRDLLHSHGANTGAGLLLGTMLTAVGLRGRAGGTRCLATPPCGQAPAGQRPVYFPARFSRIALIASSWSAVWWDSACMVAESSRT